MPSGAAGASSKGSLSSVLLAHALCVWFSVILALDPPWTVSLLARPPSPIIAHRDLRYWRFSACCSFCSSSAFHSLTLTHPNATTPRPVVPARCPLSVAVTDTGLVTSHPCTSIAHYPRSVGESRGFRTLACGTRDDCLHVLVQSTLGAVGLYPGPTSRPTAFDMTRRSAVSDVNVDNPKPKDVQRVHTVQVSAADEDSGRTSA